MTALTIGAVPAIPTPAPATDVDGTFSSLALVPQLANGTQAILVTIGAISANTSVVLTAAPAVVTVTETATETIFADSITAGTLERVWKFDNTTKIWGMYDPRDAFAASNTYTTTSSGDPVWVNYTEETVFQGTTYTEGWSLLVLD